MNKPNRIDLYNVTLTIDPTTVILNSYTAKVRAKMQQIPCELGFKQSFNKLMELL